MTLFEIAQKIDKSKENSCKIKFSNFAREFHIRGLDDDYDNQVRLKAYFIIDEYAESDIGTIMYFLDNKPVCISSSEYVKNFKWFDKESANAVETYCRCLVNKKAYNFIDINTEYPETFGFKYLGLRTTDNCIVNGKAAIIKMRNNDDSVDIVFEDGSTMRIKSEDVRFKINIKEN